MSLLTQHASTIRRSWPLYVTARLITGVLPGGTGASSSESEVEDVQMIFPRLARQVDGCSREPRNRAIGNCNRESVAPASRFAHDELTSLIMKSITTMLVLL